MVTILLCWAGAGKAGHFENLGVPIKSAGLFGAAVGVDEKENEVIYFNCSQPGGRLFLLQVNPKTGDSRQFEAPIGEGARDLIVAPNHCVYLGTWEGGYLLKFNPKQPDRGLVSLGKPSATETYMWHFAIGNDGCVYTCTYPQARLIRHDPKTDQSEDFGRLDPTEMYARTVASSTNGFVYVGIGTVRAQIIQFNPKTGEKKSLIAEADRPAGTGLVFRGEDGAVYGRVTGRYFRCDADRLTALKDLPSIPNPKLRDGREITSTSVENGKVSYTLTKNGKSVVNRVAFESKGLQLFAIGAGPDGNIFGSSVLPLEIFEFNRTTRTSRHLGNSPGAEVYSFVTDGKLLYACSYPRSYLTVYDPVKPWKFGESRANNPRGIGYMGDGHLRPRAMIIGFDGLGIYDPSKYRIVENYRNLIQDQGISALCSEPGTKMIFGGSAIGAGGGGRAVAKECVVFAWDPTKKQKAWEKVIVPGDSNVAAMAIAHGKVFGVSRPSQTLFVVDPKTFEIVHQAKVPFGSVHEVSLAYYQPHDCIYGLAKNSVFKVDPKTFEITEIGRSLDPITCGFAITEDGIYFGSKTQLIRWNWKNQ